MTAEPSPHVVGRHLEAVAAEVARIAADSVRAVSGDAVVAATKSSDTDVVTVTDRATEQLIRDELRRRCPGSAIAGEEFDAATGVNNVGWIVDPIDGTVNFLYDLPVVSVSIAATLDGVPVAGAVADVHRGETYSAAVGTGARRDGVAIAVSGADDLALALVGTGFAYQAELRATEARVVADLLPRCRDIRCMGSAALNLCWVADGRLDAFYERDLKPYDHAAGAVIASEAGALVGQPGDVFGDLTIAATPSLFESLERIVGGPLPRS